MLLCGKLSAVKREAIASCRSLSLAYNTPCRMRYGQVHVAVGHKGGKSLVLLPVLVFENVQQSAKQNLTPNFRKPSRLRSKPFAKTTFGEGKHKI